MHSHLLLLRVDLFKLFLSLRVFHMQLFVLFLVLVEHGIHGKRLGMQTIPFFQDLMELAGKTKILL